MGTIALSTTALREAVRTYIPELDSEDRRDAVTGALLDGPLPSTPGDARPLPAPAPPADRDVTLAHWTRHLVGTWTRDVRRRLTGLPVLAEPARVDRDALDGATTAVAPIVQRALLAALHRRRCAGLLRSDTPEDRFDDFRDWLASPAGAEDLRRDYGASFEVARHRAVAHVTHLLEVASRWAADRADAARVLPAIDGRCRILALHPGSGDTHDHGRSVTVVDLTGKARVVYKPRSLAPDAAFGAILAAVDDAVGTALRAVRFLDRGGWGWAEHIDRGGTPTDPVRHRERLGALTGVLHLLGATDIHFENVVTDESGRPVLVDAETLLTPRAPRRASYDDGAASTAARALVERSVLGIGTLPLVVSVPGREARLDIGVAGAMTPGQAQPFASLVVRNSGRDDMHVALEYRTTTEGNANPGLGGGDLDDVLAYRDAVGRGVARVLTWARTHPREVADVFRRHLTGLRLRYIHAPTVFYAQLLRMQTHPEVLADAHTRLAVLGRVHARGAGDVRPIGAFEVDQLLDGDVPMFTFATTDTHLRDAHGTVLVTDYFAQTPLDSVLAWIEDLDDAHVARQMDFVDLGFVPVTPDGGETTATSWPTVSPATPGQREDARRVLAHQVMRRWVGGPDRTHPATFYGPQVTTADASQWTPGVLGYDLYGGSIGLALALSVSGATADDAATRARVEAITAPITHQMVSGALDAHELSVGGMTGAGGTAWALGVIAAHEDSLLDRDALVRALARQAREDTPGEFVSGAAGALAAALALTRRNPGGRAHLEEHLSALAAPVARAARSVLREGRATPDGHSAYTGFAHGVAGLLTPLAEAGVLLDDPRLTGYATDLAESLITARRVHGRWPRQLDGSSTSHAWCHGAPGILLALTGLSRATPAGDPVPGPVLDDLLTETLTHALGNNPSLCHGDLGTLDIVLECARLRGDTALETDAADALATSATRIATTDRRVARDRYRHTDSLMVGTAGALYALARAADPSVPCVLALR